MQSARSFIYARPGTRKVICRVSKEENFGPYPLPPSDRPRRSILSFSVLVSTSTASATAAREYGIYHADLLHHDSAQYPTREGDLSPPGGDVDLLIFRMSWSTGTRWNNERPWRIKIDPEYVLRMTPLRWRVYACACFNVGKRDSCKAQEVNRVSSSAKGVVCRATKITSFVALTNKTYSTT